MEQLEQLHTGTNANEISNLQSGKNEKNQELIEQKPIEGTPFTMITQTATGKSFLTIGQFRVTEETEKPEELIKLTKGVKWNFLTNVMSVIVETYLNERGINKN